MYYDIVASIVDVVVSVFSIRWGLNAQQHKKNTSTDHRLIIIIIVIIAHSQRNCTQRNTYRWHLKMTLLVIPHMSINDKYKAQRIKGAV